MAKRHSKPAPKAQPDAIDDPHNVPSASEEALVEAAKPAKYVTIDEHFERTNLVKMVRGESYPAPHEADVHPDMVDDYAAGGWEKA